MRFGNEYATVTHEVIEGLMRRADPQTGLHHLDQPVFRCGGKVRILEGPFERLEGLFECYEGEARALILLDVLGGATRVRVPLDPRARAARLACACRSTSCFPCPPTEGPLVNLTLSLRGTP